MTKHLCDIDGNGFSVQIYLIHELLRTQEIMTFFWVLGKKKFLNKYDSTLPVSIPSDNIILASRIL